MYVNAIRSFYGTFDISLKPRGAGKLPKPKVLHTRRILSDLEVKHFVLL
ncbi:MAG: hypothetical protein WED05_05320 [Candidatus Atabeyarchaeum deiterrae]